MGSDLSLRVLLRAVDSGASSVVQGLGKTIAGLSGPAGIAVTALLAVGAAIVGVGAASVQSAANWQSALTTLVTGAGESQSNLQMVSNGMLQLAVDTGTSTKQLVDGMYMIESGGYHGAAGLAILKAAAEGAKVGNADLGTVADATDTILKNFGQHGLTASQAVNTLIATVSHGKTTMQQLSSALSGILPVAAATGISLNDTAAAMSTMTGEGVPAAQAATFLRQTLLALNAPTVAASRQLKDVGLTTQQVSDAMKQSLPNALKLITDAVGKKFTPGSAQYIAALKNIAGGSKNLQGMLDLTGTHLKTFKDNVSAVSGSVKKGGGSINGWSLVQQNFNQKMSQAKEVVETLMIKIGTALLPTVTSLLSAVLPVITAFANWVIHSGILTTTANILSGGIKGVVGVIHTLISTGAAIVGFFAKNKWAVDLLIGAFAGLVVGGLIFIGTLIPPLIASFIAWAAAAGAAALATLIAAAPFILIGLAVMALVAIILLLVQHWSQVVAFLRTVWTAFASWFSGTIKAVGQFFVNLWSGITSGVGNFFSGLGSLVHNGLTALWNAFTAPFRAIGQLFVWLYNHNTYFKKLIDTIRVIIAFGVAWLKGQWQRVINWLVGLWNNISGWASSSWTKLKQTIIDLTVALAVWIYGQWEKVSSWLTDKWNSFSGLASKAWQAVSGVFSSIWGKYVSGPLGKLWTSFTNWFNNLKQTAITWGENLIKGFIKGIENMAGQVAQAAQNVAKNVAGFLGFHSPAQKGEGRYIIQWGSNMLKGFSSGVLQAIPQLQTAVNMAVHTGLQPMSPPALASTVPAYGRPPVGNTYNSSIAGGGTHNYTVSVRAETDNPKKLAAALEKEISLIHDKKFRRSGVMGNPAAGGRSS